MNLVITGAAGYIGSVVAEVLLREGHSVTALDNFSTGHRPAIPRGAALFECALDDRRRLGELFSSQRFDAVIHLAAEALVEKSTREPELFYAVNVAGGVNLLEAMLRNKCKRIIFSSSAAVYGEPTVISIPEDHPKAPVNPYGASKWRFEQILEDFRGSAGLAYTVFRFFNVAGASEEHGEDHADETHLIPRAMQAARGQREFINLNGEDHPTPDGTCIRDYVHVLDLAEACRLALANFDRANGEAFNLGSDHGFSNREVVEAVRRVTRREFRVVMYPKRAGDPARLVASAEKIHRVLGWKPKYPDLDGIIATAWSWMERFPNGYASRSATGSH